MSDNVTAKEVLDFAKNRLNKFYNRAREKRIKVNLGGMVTTAAPGGIAGTGSPVQGHAATPPEIFGPYNEKTEMGNGVLKRSICSLRTWTKRSRRRVC